MEEASKNNVLETGDEDKPKLPHATIMHNSYIDNALIKQYGSMEMYFISKISRQRDEIVYYKKEISALKKDLYILESALDECMKK